MMPMIGATTVHHVFLSDMVSNTEDRHWGALLTVEQPLSSVAEGGSHTPEQGGFVLRI